MSGCHEPKENISDLIREYMFFVDQSFKSLEKLIKLNEAGLNKCFEWAEKHEQEINSVIGQLEGLSDHIEKVGDQAINGLSFQKDQIDALLERIKKIESALENYREYRTSIEDLETDTMYIKESIKKIEDQTTKDAIYNQNCFQNLVNEIKRLDGFIHPDLILWARTDVTGRLEALEALLRTQVEINKNYDERINDIEKIESEKRLIALESHKNYQTDENRKVSKRMDEFEKQILETRVQFIGELGNKKIPHKCPICEGKGKYQSLNPEPPYVLHNLCETCEGKGIIWN